MQATISLYASNNCKESTLEQRQYFGIGCAVSVLDSYAQDAVAYSTSLQCSSNSGSSSAVPVPSGSLAREYVLQT